MLAFDAHVVNWSVDDSPPPSFSRHYIRGGSFYGIDTYSFSLDIKVPDEENLDAPLLINFIGIREDSMYPGKRGDGIKESANNMLGHPMNLLELLDEYLEKETSGAVDSLLMGCVAGVVNI